MSEPCDKRGPENSKNRTATGECPAWQVGEERREEESPDEEASGNDD